MLIPSMGRLSSEAMAAAFRGIGVRASALRPYDAATLKAGRASASGKECLPLLLTVGGLLEHLENRADDSEHLAYFMPFTPGNCRFPQYRVFLRKLIDKRKLRNVALFSLTADKGYSCPAFTPGQRLSFLKAFIAADVFQDIQNAITVLAVDRPSAQSLLENEWSKVVDCFSDGRVGHLYETLEGCASSLATIPLRYPLADARKVALMGEIFVRRDEFSSRGVLEMLAKREIVVKKAHFFEWIKYVDHIVKLGIYQPQFTVRGRIQFEVKLQAQNAYEKRIKGIMARSGLYEYEISDIESLLEYGKHFFDLEFRGESVLVAGGFFKHMLHSIHGLISVGPFGCMPTRVIEAVLGPEATLETKLALGKRHGPKNWNLNGVTALPFLSVESDGNALPQVLEARIEAFCLQVTRLHGLLHGSQPKALLTARAPAGNRAEIIPSRV
jgi:predicted nucleotide-binding protein (sugar kinase/HSP70/actin superfamily)